MKVRTQTAQERDPPRLRCRHQRPEKVQKHECAGQPAAFEGKLKRCRNNPSINYYWFQAWSGDAMPLIARESKPCSPRSAHSLENGIASASQKNSRKSKAPLPPTSSRRFSAYQISP